MLNPFPLLFLAPVTYFILRVVLGFVLIHTSHRILTEATASTQRKLVAVLLGGAGGLLVLGLYTQIGALLSFVITTLCFARQGTLPGLARTTLLFMVVISFSLFITGAGSFAFDIPL